MGVSWSFDVYLVVHLFQEALFCVALVCLAANSTEDETEKVVFSGGPA